MAATPHALDVLPVLRNISLPQLRHQRSPLPLSPLQPLITHRQAEARRSSPERNCRADSCTSPLLAAGSRECCLGWVSFTPTAVGACWATAEMQSLKFETLAVSGPRRVRC